MSNILSIFLRECNVRHTILFTETIFEEHPERHTLFGLKDMLHVFGIDTAGIKYEDKTEADISVPCIMQIPGDFVVCTDLTDNRITYNWNGKKVTKSVSEFCTLWTGIALTIDSFRKNTCEPDYKRHRRDEIQKSLLVLMLLAMPIVVWSIAFLSRGTIPQSIITIGVISDWIGAVLCLLLVDKQVFHGYRLSDKVCSVFHLNDCHKVLSSPQSRIGFLSWSEIGFGYFTGRLFSYLLFPYSPVALAAVGWLAMLYGVWSLWQQAKVLRNLCVLCILVQVVVWFNGVNDALHVYIMPSNVSSLLWNFTGIGCVIILFTLVIHLVVEGFNKDDELRNRSRKLSAFKADCHVFATKLSQSEECDTSGIRSRIMFGNKNARHKLTVLTNPLCNPCARLHRRLDVLLATHGDRLSVSYVLTSFGERYENINRMLMAVYFQSGIEHASDIFRQWYSGETEKVRKIVKEMNLDLNASDVAQEVASHKDWCEKTGFTSTPIILYGNHLFPKEYEIEDLKYI